MSYPGIGNDIPSLHEAVSRLHVVSSPEMIMTRIGGWLQHAIVLYLHCQYDHQYFWTVVHTSRIDRMMLEACKNVVSRAY